MATTDIWVDFDQIRHNIKNNTVDKLKQILTGLNDECHTHLSKSGKKQEIIDRIVNIFDTWRATNMVDMWTKAKAVVYQVRNCGMYSPPNRTQGNFPVPPAPGISRTMYNVPATKALPYLNAVAPSSSSTRYDPYLPPRNPTSVASSSALSVPKPPAIRFKESPFFRIDQAVSGIMECPESTSATDRRQQAVTFTLNNDQLAKLQATGSQYQLRLFCTSSIFYSGSLSFRPNMVPCPIEFPPTCEVRVNTAPLAANLKGLKKKPGTAPPPDLGKLVRQNNLQNRVEMIYVNSQQPVQSKKYYLVVMLVQFTGVDKLVEKLKSTSYKSSHDIQQQMASSLVEDDDIIAGPQKMSLKCPLSFMRVQTPCRSSKCVHSQCFDATSWFSVMEQTTTWLCPVCEKSLDYNDLIIDGYFDEILKRSPESVDDVIVEADGEWHTSDNKFGSDGWKTSHPTHAPTTNIPPPQKRESTTPILSQKPAKSPPLTSGGAPSRGNVEIVVLDSDDEDEGRVKRELSPSYGSGSSVSAPHSFDNAKSLPRPNGQSSDVIDLTVDSDDEATLTKQSGKRRASDADLNSTSPTEQIWKKGRLDPDRALAASVLQTAPSTNLYTHSSPRDPPTTSTRYQSNTFSNGIGSYPPRPGVSASTPQLPPLSSQFLPRTGGRWP